MGRKDDILRKTELNHSEMGEGATWPNHIPAWRSRFWTHKIWIQKLLGPSVLHRSPDLMLKTECGLNHHHHHTLHHSPLTTIFLTSLKHTEGSHQNKIKISKQLKKVLDISWSQHSDQTSTVHYWDTTTHSMSRERGLLDSVTTTFYNKLYFMFLTSANEVSTSHWASTWT